MLVAYASGKRKLPRALTARWFSEMSSGPCGRSEDPAEDEFTSLVVTPRGSFRIIEGIWESAAFFLQRIVNVVDGMPDGQNWAALKRSVYSLLKLSDLICERAELARYTFGARFPNDRLPTKVRARLSEYRNRVVFSENDLRVHGLSLDALAPFVFDPQLRSSIPNTSLSHSPLLHFPLLVRNSDLVVVLPTAISIAIRAFVVGTIIHGGLTEALQAAMAAEYCRCFAYNPVLGTASHPPLYFRPSSNGIIGSYALEFDTGRALQVLCVLDTLEGFEDRGFGWVSQNPFGIGADIDHEIEECRRALSKRQICEGFTLVIDCGIGRAAAYVLPNTKRTDWSVAHVSAADAALLGLVRSMSPSCLWRILHAQSCLARHNVHIHNMNGLLNLVAWVRSLNGHLVEHSQMPAEFSSARPCHLLIDQARLRNLRMEVAEEVDRHALETVDGRWVEVRKPNESVFAEDRALPLYVALEREDECQLPIVFETPTRNWWCRVTYPRDYHRWKVMVTWLPRIATIVESTLDRLPTGALLINVRFDAWRNQPYEGEPPTKQEIESDITTEVNSDQRVITIRKGEAFERGLAYPANISEAALVTAIISAIGTFAGERDASRIDGIVQRVVPDEHGRSSHAFQARHFRDFVQEALREAPVVLDAIDDATLRLGLGWKVRRQEEGAAIEGRIACTTFLNSLVKALEAELCSDLKAFNRSSLVRLALYNHEVASVAMDVWYRTSAATLSIHEDKLAALARIAEQEFEKAEAQVASRILVEVALCECPLEGGRVAARIDFAQLIAKVLAIVSLGGISDQIHYEATAASLRITPLGDVQVGTSFFDQILKPFGYLTSEKRVRSAISRYGENFEVPDCIESAESAFDSKFIDAWNQEHGFTVDELRRMTDTIEDYAIRRGEPIVIMRRSETRARIAETVRSVDALLNAMTIEPRRTWRTVPDNSTEADIHPWRFRRGLSLVRRPFIQLDNSSDPMLMIAPGLLRDGMAYMVRGYHDGSFPRWQIKSKAMRRWFGDVAEKRGRRFAGDVIARMQRLGWRAEDNVPVTKILRKGFDRNYGDVDVLAWNASTGRVLLMECKDLHFHKTAGELAEQLSDFRGEMRHGKPDLLRKHLDRCEILLAHADRLQAYLGIKNVAVPEVWMVFRNPVPMLFAWQKLKGAVRIATYEDLEHLCVSPVARNA